MDSVVLSLHAGNISCQLCTRYVPYVTTCIRTDMYKCTCTTCRVHSHYKFIKATMSVILPMSNWNIINL